MAYSSGFNPHPRVSFANAAPTGAASEAEYLEIGLKEPCNPDAIRTALDAAVATLLGCDEFEVTRLTKAGVRAFDARAAVIELSVVDDTTIELVSRHGVPLVRPDDVVQALGKLDPGFTPSVPALYTRLTQGEWVDGRMVEPFGGAPDS